MKETVSVRFYLRKARTSKKGETPIIARIKIGGLVKDDYIRQSIPMNRWDQAKEKCTGRDALANQINSYLNDYRTKYWKSGGLYLSKALQPLRMQF